MSDALNRLAALAGIEDGWWDFFGTWRVVSDDTKRAFLSAMGFSVADEAALKKSLAAFEERPWRRWLEPVQVVHERHGPPRILLTLPASRDGGAIDWVLEEEIGIVHRGGFLPADLEIAEERTIEGQMLRRRVFELPGLPPPGYHRLSLRAADGAEGKSTLIVVPPHSFIPEVLDDSGRVWGIAAQLYALRSGRDWGVGDYGSLRELAAEAAPLGAAAVGINPLHALFPNQPEKYSPYSPSSRVFVNVVCLDVPAIADFADSAAAQEMVGSREVKTAIQQLRSLKLVDYPAVFARKRPVLEAIYRDFRKRHLDGPGGPTERGRAFRQYQAEGGRAAELFVTFEALQEHFMRRGSEFSWWRRWPGDFRNPDSPAVAAFALERRDRVEFFWYLQWQADVQLASAQAECRAGGMPIGLYRDLAVGIADDGGEAWARQGCLALGVTIGAPPDPLSPNGQDWGLTPFDPVAMREAAYAPFIEVLRANMRHAGAIRLDHAMSLQRLYWIPRGAKADQGAYVRFAVDELVGLVALESRRNRCLVIGEDLGTVPEGFRERMAEAGLFGYRLLVFERRDDGSYRPPGEYAGRALVSVATHDLPSLRGWWAGSDVERRVRLDLYPKPGMGDEERAARQEARLRLREALAAEGFLSPEFPLAPQLSDEDALGLADAAHDYLARSPAKMMMVAIEDALGFDLQMNLPGTTVEHPNWRVRLPVTLAEALRHPRLVALARRLLDGRCPDPTRVQLPDHGGG